jgi:hypothetical protein
MVSDELGTFRVDLELENPLRAGDRRMVRSVLVDTGAELSWFPSDVLDSLGIARRRVSRCWAPDHSRGSTCESIPSRSG